MQRRGSDHRRGFTLLVVVLLVGLMSVMVGAMLDVVTIDQSIGASQRGAERAFVVADAGLAELMANDDLKSRFPRDFDTPTEVLPFVGDPDALMTNSVVDLLNGDYEAEVTLIKKRRVAENSLKLLEALTYEVSVVGQAQQGRSVSRVRSRTETTIASNAGRIAPAAVTR